MAVAPQVMEDHVMLCEHCHGQRIVTDAKGAHPCPECDGRGETHCCDGLQEQPLAKSAVADPQAIIGKVDPRMYRRAS